jgi:hypothetical protein
MLRAIATNALRSWLADLDRDLLRDAWATIEARMV